MIRYFKSVFLIFLGVYLTLLVYYFVMQKSVIFYPTKDYAKPPIGFNIEEIFIKTQDGQDLHAWWMDRDADAGTVIFFHGNAGNLTDRSFRMDIFKRLNLNVLMIDYRGYGKSSGKIEKENDLYLDGEAAWMFLTEKKNIDPKNIIIWGRSVGGAVAVYLAQGRDINALVVESSFSSLSSVGERHFPFLPVEQILRFKFKSEDIIQNVKAPILFTHSREDDIIPFEEGKILYERASEPKEFLELPKGGHNTDLVLSYDEYIEGVSNFLSSLVVSNREQGDVDSISVP